jgi:hypothetical protein
MKMLTAMLLLGCAASSAHATIYAYVDDNGDYVVTQKRPGKSVAEYAVLTDDGEFVRLVQARDPNVPITHWRPWFIPKDPDPYDADPDSRREREGTVDIDEIGP